MAKAVCTTPAPYERCRLAYSPLQRERLVTDCKNFLPDVLNGCPEALVQEAVPTSSGDVETIRSLFPSTFDTPLVNFAKGSEQFVASLTRSPMKVGVVLSGGQAPGGHNVIAGIFDGIKQWHKDSEMIGFIDGPHGIMTGHFCEITAEIMDGFRNTGGFDMLGSGRHKIESDEQFKSSMAVCQGINLDGLVVIGGDDSNTNGALLAEYFKANGCKTKVVGAPKTIDGDLKCPPHIPISFGFDTACKTFANQTANVAVDALSAQKYYHLVRLMGRSASNIALEVALITRPNACLLGEEVAAKKQSLRDLTLELTDMVEQRSNLGKDYGVIVLPEGLIEFIPEFNALMSELNDKLADPEIVKEMEASTTCAKCNNTFRPDSTFCRKCGAPRPKGPEETIASKLSQTSAESFHYLPPFIRAQLLLDRDPHGNVQVSKIETEKLLAATVGAELEERKKKGTYKGNFVAQYHSFGYEGRAGMPTQFDSSYCYALGATASFLLANNMTGLIASVKNLLAPPKEWQCGGVPITSLCVIERRKGKNKPVIRKALVELDGPLSQPYVAFKAIREELRLKDAYRIPGPIQYGSDCPATMEIPITLELELSKPLEPLKPDVKAQKMGKIIFAPLPRESRSELQQWRSRRAYRSPDCLAQCDLLAHSLEEGVGTEASANVDLRDHFTCVDSPLLKVVQERKMQNTVHKIGVVFCGRQSPGCHDLLCGLIDMLGDGTANELLGIVGGTQGLFAKHYVKLTKEMCHSYQGTGGLDLLGRTVDKISSEDHEKTLKACMEMHLSGLVLVGGTRTNTDAAHFAEYCLKQGVNPEQLSIVGVPCGIEGSMVNEFVEASLGFDSSAKAMAQLVGNTALDGSSARKYYYFLKMMESAGGNNPSSHVALEVALLTKPNVLLLVEEINEKRMSLRDVVDHVTTIVQQRAAKGKNFGTIIISEGLLEAVPEFRNLIEELQAIQMPCPIAEVLPQLTAWSRALFETLPEFMQRQLLLERQSNAVMQLGQLETERLIAELVEEELNLRKSKGLFKGSFSAVCQYFGYQARCSMPSDFDSDYAYALGGTAAILATSERSGYMAIVTNLSKPVAKWNAGGVPFTAMMTFEPVYPPEKRKPRPTIIPSCVDLKGGAFLSWCKVRAACVTEEMYENPGPIQFSGKSAGDPCTTIATRFSYVQEVSELAESLAAIASKCRPGCDPRKVRVAAKSLATLNAILDELKGPLTASSVLNRRTPR